MRPPRGSQRGAAVVTALLVVALCVTLVTTMFVQQQTATRALEARRLRAQADALRGTVVDWAVTELVESARESAVDHLQQRWARARPQALLSTWVGGQVLRRATFEQNGQDPLISAAIEDAQARFNLMTLVTASEGGKPAGVRASGTALYRRLLGSLGIDSALAGPTADYMLRSLQPDGPLPIADFAGLMAVPGYSRETVERLTPYVVVLPAPTSVNMNTAGPEVLAASIPGITVSQARALVADRERAWFRSAGDLELRLKAIAPALPEAQGLLVEARSQYFLVHGEIRNGRAVRRVEALIQRDGIGVSLRTSVVWLREPEVPWAD